MELNDVRKEIDSVDQEIKKLFKKRMMLADEVAIVKARTEDDIFKPEREKEIVDKLTMGVDQSIKREYTALIKRIMEISRKYQYGRTLELRNCLNLDYVSKEPELWKTAVLKNEMRFCKEYDDSKIISVDSYDEMEKTISSGAADSCIGVIEDIGFGVSDEFHTLILKNKLYINHCDILSDGERRLKLVRVSKLLVAGDDDNRLKIMFVCSNKSGSLASVLAMIADYGVNMTEIHSIPDKNKDWNYIFMVELAANIKQQEIKAMIFQLISETEKFQIMGSYKY